MILQYLVLEHMGVVIKIQEISKSKTKGGKWHNKTDQTDFVY